MANFFTDNEDILFLFEHLDLSRVGRGVEEQFRFGDDFDDAPKSEQEAIEKYRQILTTIGRIAGDDVAPTAPETDRIGNILNDDGTVTYAPGIQSAIERLGEEGLMGFTLPYRYGGKNCPNLVYTMSNDIISRADASLMNLYGLQGIAETVNAFASDELKEEYLPSMASGAMTGAMVLTEPNAGSDLQNVQVEAFEGEDGQWHIRGSKRFITNGCGHVLLVLARSEPDITDGRGLSLFLVERGPTVKVNRLENKMGINGSPTCELTFDGTPAKLVGERKQGLITYVMALMYGARVGVAAQAVGIAEAAYRVARSYAANRKQFGTTIDSFPAVKDMLVEMSIGTQAARALTYFASFCVDIEQSAARRMNRDEYGDPDEKKADKQLSRTYRRYNNMLTPMAKYFASENSIHVCSLGVQVLGGSGYMKEFHLERHLRDARITTIYEGTSQMQIVAGVGAVTSGIAKTMLEDLIDSAEWPEDIMPQVERIRKGIERLEATIEFIKNRGDDNLRRLHARRLVDMAIVLIVGALFCDQARDKEAKKKVARYWLATRMAEFDQDIEIIRSDEHGVLDDFDELAVPIDPEAAERPIDPIKV